MESDWELGKIFLRFLLGQSLTEERRLIGDDAVDSEVCKAPHFGGIVDRPDHDFLSGSLYLADKLWIDQRLVGNDVSERKLGPEAKLRFRFADQAEGNRRVLIVQGFES